MASTNDIDAKSAVRKFLERRSVVNREDTTADSADEVDAILESVALSFLLYPQAALSFILQAKNVLQQITSTNRDVLDFMLKAVDDVENPDEPITDTSDLLEAQTALVEVDRLGQIGSEVRAYERYTRSVTRFLDRRLSRSLKRHHRQEFERTGYEAKQDLFRVLSAFSSMHGLMINRLGLLLAGVENFRSVALTKIVSARTLTKVRSSLTQVIRGIQRQELSKTAAAIELLSGAAALSSISNSRDIYDPTVDTGSYPTDRRILLQSERTPAVATGTAETVSLGAFSTPWDFVSTVDGTTYSATLPVTGASGRHYVKAALSSSTFDIPVGQNVLYVQFDGITPPSGEAAMVRAVSLPTGTVGIGTVLTVLNGSLVDGTAVEISPGRLLVYGSASVTGITIKNGVQGTFDVTYGSPTFGTYTPAVGSVHSILGFTDEQTSGDPEVFTPTELVDLLTGRMPLAALEVLDTGEAQISTISTEVTSSLEFSGEVAEAFGFEGLVTPVPTYLELTEDGESVDPSSVGVFVGSVVSAAGLFSSVEEIEDTKLFFADPLPLLAEGEVRVTSPAVFSVQSLLDNVRTFTGKFDGDLRTLQRVLSPLLSRPTLAQISEAKIALAAIRAKVDDLFTKLSSIIVRSDRFEFDSVAKQIAASLEERGLDRGLELLQSCQFLEFFSLTSDTASKGNRFLKASADVGRNDLASTTIEENQDDPPPLSGPSDENLLPGEELLEDEEQL